MRVAPSAQNAERLSYLALRQAVGWIALLLPIALPIPLCLMHQYPLPPSISDYYYTGMRNLLVGSLCAIGLFNFCARGYDLRDTIAGVLSALCAIGVAFCPTTPSMTLDCPVPQNALLGNVHWALAAVLFVVLAYMCMVLFTSTAKDRELTRQKLARNRVYIICGSVMLASMLVMTALKVGVIFKWWGENTTIAGIGTTFCFEATALVAFGIAWLVKGETFLKDEPAERGKHPR